LFLNAAAWALFLALTPRIPDAERARMTQQRIELDLRATQGWPGGIDFDDHPPSLVAERWFSPIGGWQRLLFLMSGPAIGFAEKQFVPWRHVVGMAPTSRESYSIAATAFLF